MKSIGLAMPILNSVRAQCRGGNLTIAALFACVTMSAQAQLTPALSRSAVVNLYNTEYLSGNTPPAIGWTGNVASCLPGDNSAAWRTAMIDRVNVFRKLARVTPAIVGNTAGSQDEQTMAAALIFAANGKADQSVLQSTFPTCFNASYDGATVGERASAGAARSSVAYMPGTNLAATPALVDGFMDNIEPTAIAGKLSNRRWILYPGQQQMLASSVPFISGTTTASTSALFVSDHDLLPNSAPDGVAWPPRGFVPYQLMPSTSNRWSYSFPRGDFTSAVVTMSKGNATGALQQIPIVAYDERSNGLLNTYGENTLVWRPNTNAANGGTVTYGNPGDDDTYYVTITGIKCILSTACPTMVRYAVTVIDPARPTFTVSGTTTLNGNAVTDAGLCSSPPGAECTVTGSNYSCIVPSGFTGTLHAGSATAWFPAAQVSNVTANQTINFTSTRADDGSRCLLDANRNGLYEAEIDAVVLARRMAGFTPGGFADVNNPFVCARNDTEQALYDASNPSLFNATGNPTGPFASDGLIIARVMQGMRGAAVPLNALPPSPVRSLWTGAGQLQEWFTNTCGYPAN